MDGFSKLDTKAFGYYQDGFPEAQDDREEDTKDSLENLVPVTLKLDGLIPDLERIGKPPEATMQDDKTKEQRTKVRKHKASKPRAAKVKNTDE